MLTLLDTDTLSLHLKGHPKVMAQVQAYTQLHGVIHFSLITYYEILNGLLYKDARNQLGRFQSLVLDSRLLPLTPTSIGLSAQVSADLRRAGQLIEHTDILIAGVALANQMQLATNNTRHYERIEGLQLMNWTL